MEEAIRKILDLARQAGPIVEALKGTPYIGAAVTAADAVLDLIDEVKDTTGASQEELQSTRDELEQRVNDHADDTIGKLRGE